MSGPAVSVVMPYRPDSVERELAYAWTASWWQHSHPGWELVVADVPRDGRPWSKGTAVAAGLARAGGEIAVVADADVICEQTATAVRQVHAGAAPWAIPHLAVLRLTRQATMRVYETGALPQRPQLVRRLPQDRAVFERAHRGVAGGGLVVLPAELGRQVPMDPRFAGWGQEDMAWALALSRMAGLAWRGQAPLWHLWHPPAPRRSRAVGSPQSWALYERYRQARTPEAMRALVSEAAATLTSSP